MYTWAFRNVYYYVDMNLVIRINIFFIIFMFLMVKHFRLLKVCSDRVTNGSLFMYVLL